MKTLLIAVTALFFTLTGVTEAKSNFAKADQWTSGWSQGADEYSAASKDDAVYVLIACTDSKPGELWFGMFRQANDQPVSGTPVFTIDGKSYVNPLSVETQHTEANYRAFWNTLRQAKTLTITVGTMSREFPVERLRTTLPGYDTPNFSCKLGF